MIGCDCKAGLSNTGRPGCVPVQGIVSSMILVPLTATDGTKNGIDLSATLPVWADLVNEADASKRWFPLPAFENVEVPKADSLFEEANSGRSAFLRQGKRSFTGELWAEDSTPTFLGKLQASRCVEFGIFIVDVNGNLIGTEVDGFLYPIPVDNSSWNPVFMFATDSTVQKIMLGFDFNRLFDDSTMYLITEAEAGINFNSLEGLIDVVFTNVSATVTAVTLDANFAYGTALNKLPFAGALAADFAINNDTAASTINILSLLEGPDGTYVITYVVADAPTVGDAITVSVNKIGFNGKTTVTVA
tara:strand:- start:10947 stop:11855 length:909 start_codon:yes stop_codon:yes gene_type:complete